VLSEFLAYIGFCADSLLSCFCPDARACCRHVPFTLASGRKHDSIRCNKTGSKELGKHRTLIKKGNGIDRRKRGVPWWGTDGKGGSLSSSFGTRFGSYAASASGWEGAPTCGGRRSEWYMQKSNVNAQEI